MTESGLPLLYIPRPKPTGILTECTVMNNLSRTLNMAFDCETFCTKVSIKSAANWFLCLILIPMGLSLWFSRLCIVIPTMSLSFRFCNAWRNKSFKLTKNSWHDFNCQSVEGANHNLRTRGTETSILPCNCDLNLESASHGLQKLREYVLYHTENYLRYSTIKHHIMIITYQSSVAVRNIFTKHN